MRPMGPRPLRGFHPRQCLLHGRCARYRQAAARDARHGVAGAAPDTRLGRDEQRCRPVRGDGGAGGSCGSACGRKRCWAARRGAGASNRLGAGDVGRDPRNRGRVRRVRARPRGAAERARRTTFCTIYEVPLEPPRLARLARVPRRCSTTRSSGPPPACGWKSWSFGASARTRRISSCRSSPPHGEPEGSRTPSRRWRGGAPAAGIHWERE
jgi:hypothetical protein